MNQQIDESTNRRFRLEYCRTEMFQPSMKWALRC